MYISYCLTLCQYIYIKYFSITSKKCICCENRLIFLYYQMWQSHFWQSSKLLYTFLYNHWTWYTQRFLQHIVHVMYDKGRLKEDFKLLQSFYVVQMHQKGAINNIVFFLILANINHFCQSSNLRPTSNIY